MPRLRRNEWNIAHNGVPVTAAFTVNDLGAFFAAGFVIGPNQYGAATLKARAAILIHELAHIVGANEFQPDFGKPKAGIANDKLVDQNCGKLIGSMK